MHPLARVGAIVVGAIVILSACSSSSLVSTPSVTTPQASVSAASSPTPSNHTTTPAPTPTPAATPKPALAATQWLGLSVGAEDVLKHPVLKFLQGKPGMLRTDAFWRDPAPLAESDFAGALRKAGKAHRGMLAILDYAPKAYAKRAAGECQDGDICGAKASSAGAYARFATSIVKLCRQTHATCSYELWNEPNIAQFWQPKPDPAAYTKLACAAYHAIKRADPQATVLLGGLAPSGTDDVNYSPPDFMDELYAHGIKGCFDHTATHPYDGLDQAEQVHQVMQDHGDGTKKIWATEIGFEAKAKPGTPAGRAEQKKFGGMISSWRAEPFAGPAFWYTWANDRVPDSVPHESFGLMYKDDSPKAIARTFLALAS